MKRARSKPTAKKSTTKKSNAASARASARAPARASTAAPPKKKKKKSIRNLNHRLEHRHTASVRRGQLHARIAFEPDEIVKTIISSIRHNKVKSIVGCVAWLSHPGILEEMSKKPCSIVVTYDKSNFKPHVRERYRKLTPAFAKSIKYVGGRSGRFKAKMHHKFLVMLNDSGYPFAVLTGSFNMSSNATQNLENIMYIADEEVASVFYSEWEKIWSLC